MCLILLAHRVIEGFPLVLAANRDEFFDRPTAGAGFWADAPDILGGRDLRQGGTWLGVSRDGRWGAVTNFRDGSTAPAGSRSRGELVARYLRDGGRAETYLQQLAGTAADYHGFNLLLGDASGVFIFSNRGSRPTRLAAGIYGLSNHALDTPWPKVAQGKRALAGLAAAAASAAASASTAPSDQAGERLAADLFRVLQDRTEASDPDLPETGVSRDWERLLSPMFISAPGYGTRASTVLLIDPAGGLHFHERGFAPDGTAQPLRSFRIETGVAVSG